MKILKPDYFWDSIWTAILVTACFYLGILKGIPTVIFLRESLKFFGQMFLGLDPLEYIAYGFLYDDISTTGPCNCTGFTEYDKFTDVQAVKRQILAKTESIGRMRHKIVSFCGLKWLQRLTPEEWTKYENGFVKVLEGSGIHTEEDVCKLMCE